MPKSYLAVLGVAFCWALWYIERGPGFLFWMMAFLYATMLIIPGRPVDRSTRRLLLVLIPLALGAGILAGYLMYGHRPG
ncbi:MAG TPA: hypothetical protein VKX25_10650 [Bryobacteraceae bacterium]|jgi:hypothetical protein|nr:hypothetical protein [Bryobacteraceae bacterium]